MFSLICAWTNGCANNREAGDLADHRPQYDVTLMAHRYSQLCIRARRLVSQCFQHICVGDNWPCLNLKIWHHKYHLRMPGLQMMHDDVIRWKHFPRYWSFVRGIHRSPVNSPHKGQWHGALMCSLICTRINRWVNNGEAGDLRRYRTHCDVTVMLQ